ncbi:MAG TPA: hypothetical protein VFE05_05170 [Longimicrobiaceae bacterium]|nr:hypothetical protein [Longimicrobiaceae bacterium]
MACTPAPRCSAGSSPYATRAIRTAAWASGLPGGRDHLLGEWISLREEHARGLGIGRLARLLSSTGTAGDVETAADGLWTNCGY